MQKNIAVITTDFPAPGHPTYIFVEQLVNAFVDLGNKVTVIAPQSITRHFLRGVPKMPKLSTVKTAAGNAYDVYRPYFLSLGNCSGLIKKIVGYIRKQSILHILKKIKADILYAHFWDNAVPIYKYTLATGLPMFVACGEGDEALENLDASLSEKERCEIREAVNGVISVSSENKRKCIEYNLVDGSRVEVFPNCVNTDIFKPGNNPELKKRLGIEDDDFTVAFVGGFIHRKGAARLAKAIDKLNDPHIKSIFIGQPFANDSEIPECEGIVFKGPLDHDEIPSYLNCADVFVLPTLKEGSCNAIVEALSTGLPVISSVGSFNDDIIDSSNSIRIDPMNVDAISAAIKKFKENPDFTAAIKNNLENVRGQYSIVGRAERILDFISRNQK